VANEVKLPRLGQGMESGTIVKWLKSEGEKVEKGEPLYELDTDKVTQEVEAEASGVLLKIAVRRRGAGRPDDRASSAKKAKRWRST
jgi:pyruvate/2-oxoglutarate dehydrogenase complex dihydrolipoamide acyltransferase (E2) component